MHGQSPPQQGSFENLVFWGRLHLVNDDDYGGDEVDEDEDDDANDDEEDADAIGGGVDESNSMMFVPGAHSGAGSYWKLNLWIPITRVSSELLEKAFVWRSTIIIVFLAITARIFVEGRTEMAFFWHIGTSSPCKYRPLGSRQSTFVVDVYIHICDNCHDWGTPLHLLDTVQDGGGGGGAWDILVCVLKAEVDDARREEVEVRTLARRNTLAFRIEHRSKGAAALDKPGWAFPAPLVHPWAPSRRELKSRVLEAWICLLSWEQLQIWTVAVLPHFPLSSVISRLATKLWRKCLTRVALGGKSWTGSNCKLLP